MRQVDGVKRFTRQYRHVVSEKGDLGGSASRVMRLGSVEAYKVSFCLRSLTKLPANDFSHDGHRLPELSVKLEEWSCGRQSL